MEKTQNLQPVTSRVICTQW